MRRYIRAHTPGATYFFTVNLQDRSASTLVDHVDALRAVFQDVKARHPFRIDAMVVLPEHLHAIWTLPSGDADFATRWMLARQGFTQCLVRQGIDCPTRGVHGERVLWQRRYWEHQIRDEEDFARHVDYLHFNPVKHGWVARARDWPCSSFHRFVRAGVLPLDWGVAEMGEGKFGE